MKIAVVAPSSVPFVLGGAERLWNGLVRSVNETTPHDAELVKLPSPERNLHEIVESYDRWRHVDLAHFDVVVSTKYPAWMVSHGNHVVYLQHRLRGLYDMYPSGLPAFRPDEPELADVARALGTAHSDAGLDDMVGSLRRAMSALGPYHPAFAFPGALSRAVVHAFDRVALAPGRVRRHLAISATVAGRRDYFPPHVRVEVVRHPSDLGGFACGRSDYFFTASRLDGAKRIDLLVQAMRHVDADMPLLVAGTGPDEARLRDLARGDARIRFLGYVSTEQLLELYANALAVPFVPLDEDLGLITLEAMCSSKPVVTTTDAGGPTELVVDGVNGLVTDPTPPGIGRALERLAADTEFARRLGMAGHRTASAITWSRTIDALLRSGPAPLRSSGSRPARPRLVVVSTFPVHPCLGGGQLRCFHLYGGLTDRFDVEIVSLGPSTEEQRVLELGPGLRETVVPKSAQHERQEAHITAEVGVPVTDIVAAQSIDRTPAYLDALRQQASTARAAILAHPFLLGALEHVAADLPFVYDAHNAEFQLKATILPETPLGAALLSLVREVEGRATRNAALVSACSSEDIEALASAFGVTGELFVEIPNGIDTERTPYTAADTRTTRCRTWLDHYIVASGSEQVDALALFAGSWHMPNIDAAERIFAWAGKLPDVLFALIGSHGDYFGRRFRTPPNVVRLGTVSDSHKAAMLAAARVALNPMRRGSGTNLKIVEYFAAGVPVVSTPLGARGLDVEDGLHLTIAEDDEFPIAIRRVLDDPEAAAERARRARTTVEQRYDWAILGRRLGNAIEAAVGRPS